MRSIGKQQRGPFPARHPRTFLVCAALAVLAAGCGIAGSQEHEGGELASGRRGLSFEPAELRPGAALARRFALAYAQAAYRRPLPSLPGTTAAVDRHLEASAAHLPRSRRRLRSWLSELRVWPLGSDRLGAAAWIADRRNPPFSIGFTLTRRGGRWLVTTVSPPG